jgi:mannose-1-phosphate guanylyltransferase
MMLPESLATNQIDNTDLLDITLITPVILCGGSGERLWPLSRTNYPKQFHAILGGKTIFQETLLRTNNPALFRAPLIIANKKHQYFIENECEKAGINDYQLLLEPCGRNTAPAIISACLEIIEQDPEGTLLVLPSDHFIQERELFWQEIEQAISNAALLFTGISLTI